MKNRQLGSLWMLVAGFFFAVMGVCVKLSATRYSSAELVFYRSLFGFLTILIVMLVTRKPFATPLWKSHLSRGISGFIALMLFFYAITALPLATAITLNYTAPLFLAVFTSLLLRESVKLLLWVAIVTGFLGVVLLLGPTLHREEWLAGLLGLISGGVAGLAYLQVSQLGRMGEPEWRTVFYFTLFCSLCSGLWMLTQEFHQVTLNDLQLLVGMGISATMAQLAMTRAYRKGNPLVAGSLAYSTVVMASLFGILLWNEFLSTESWLGIALIILSGIISVRFGPSPVATRI